MTERAAKVTAIMAVSDDIIVGTTGPDGPTLPWKLPPDLRRFKAMTTGHAVIMGRTTYDSIRRPLPKRMNVVVSRTERVDTIDRDGTSLWWVTSHDEALDVAIHHETAMARQRPSFEPRPFIIGGPQIWSALWPRVTHVELTRVRTSIGLGHVFGFDPRPWHEVSRSDEQLCENAERCGVREPLRYYFASYERVASDESLRERSS